MENNTVKNKKNVPFIVFSAIFGALALSAVIIFWAWKDAEWVEVYQMAMRWLVLPVCALVASYTGTIHKAPKGLMWLCPIAFGLGISVVEWATYGSFSVVLLFMGALASLFGFTFAKQDRAEKAKAAKAAKIREAMECGEELIESKESDVNGGSDPHPDFIPDENDTWADEVIANEGFGDLKVDYAESDPDFTIDAPEEAECDELNGMADAEEICEPEIGSDEEEALSETEESGDEREACEDGDTPENFDGADAKAADEEAENLEAIEAVDFEEAKETEDNDEESDENIAE